MLSICNHCAGPMCSWLMYGLPVAGWTAKPSAEYEDGWKVVRCPLYKREVQDVKLRDSAAMRHRRVQRRREK